MSKNARNLTPIQLESWQFGGQTMQMKTLFLTTTLSTFLLAGCLSTGQKLGNSALDGDFKKIQKLTSSELTLPKDVQLSAWQYKAGTMKL